MNKKLTATILTAVMATNLAITPVFAETTVIHYNGNQAKVTETQKIDIEFSDVKQGEWYYEPVMELAGKGLVGGTTKPVNGVGTYEPHKAMTRAEFATILVGYLYPEELKAYDGQYKSYWYSGVYGVAIDTGLIKTSEFSEAAMNEGTSRQEMALMLVRAMDAMGIDTTEMVDTAVIPDFNQVDSYYKDYVRVVYAKQLVGGMDAKGTFAPKYTMNRAQAATVLNKLTDPSIRIDMSAKDNAADGSVHYDPSAGATQGQTGTQTFKEGAAHQEAKPGDVVVKSDGTKVTLQNTTFDNNQSVLGVGTGVDFVTGAKLPSGYVLKDGATAEDGTRYIKCPVTNECHSADQWNDIRNFTDPNGKIKGDYDGEVYMGYWKWNANATQHFTNIQGRWDWQGPHAVS